MPARLPRQTNHGLAGTKQNRRQQATLASSPISSARGWPARPWPTNPETKEQALRYIANAIVPLMGHVRMCDVTPELERGFGEVLWHQYDDYRPVHVWKDLMRVSRGAMTRRTGHDSSLGD